MADTFRWYGQFRPALIALLSGAVLPLSFTPVSLWPAGILAMFGLAMALAGTTPKQAAILGWFFGVGMFGVGTSWIYVSIATYGNVNHFFALLITFAFVAGTALLIALFAWLLQRLFANAQSRIATPLTFAALWMAGEWFRTWFLTGFPWLFLGYSHLHSPLSSLAPLTGVMGIGFVVALTGSALHQLANGILHKSLTPRMLIHSLVPLVLIWAAANTLNFMDPEWIEETGETLSVAVVHGTVPQEEKFDPNLDLEIVDRYAEQTVDLWGHDLILWPETAIPMFYHRAGYVMDYLSQRAIESDSTLITGIFYRSDEGKIHNSIVSLGNGEGLYHKKRLVPFGEYVPLMSFIGPVLQLFDLPMSTINPGPSKQSLLTADRWSVAPSICYEVVYPELVRQGAQNADVLVTISNDTWFGDSWGPQQHLEMAAMRALENGRYMLRATNNGLSAIIDAKGNILEESTQFDSGQVLVNDIRLYRGHTPYTSWGIWPLLILGTLILGFAAHKPRR